MTIYFNSQTNKHSASVELPPQPDGVAVGVNDVIKMTEDGQIWGWYFTDIDIVFPGETGNVLDLCERYFVELKDLVIEWLKIKS